MNFILSVHMFVVTLSGYAEVITESVQATAFAIDRTAL